MLSAFPERHGVTGFTYQKTGTKSKTQTVPFYPLSFFLSLKSSLALGQQAKTPPKENYHMSDKIGFTGN